MPRPSKGARLVWRDESFKADGNLRNRAGWFIRDGTSFVSTGCGRGDIAEAERKLSGHIAAKYAPARLKGQQPHQVKIADVVSVYLDEVAAFNPSEAYQRHTGARLHKIMEFCGERTLGEINDKLCRDYYEQAEKKVAARSHLEDLRAAINHHYAEGYVTAVPKVWLPPKSEPRPMCILSKREAARLVRAAWRMRQTGKGEASDRRTGQHVARFILVALYTGTRSAAVCGAAVRPTEGRGYIDLERGVFYGLATDATDKTKRQPPVQLPDRLLAHIRRWAHTPVDIKTKSRGKSQTIGRMISHDYVVEWQGEPVQSVKKAFKTACEAAGLGRYEGGVFKTDVTPQVLLHTAATWLMQDGMDLTKAADFLGMTQADLRKYYDHRHPDYQREAAAAIVAKGPLPKVQSKVVRVS
jgi:site-specific recombinase XerD